MESIFDALKRPDDMQLPQGKTCGDCVHFSRCSSLVGARAEFTHCDWAPSRFYPKQEGNN